MTIAFVGAEQATAFSDRVTVNVPAGTLDGHAMVFFGTYGEDTASSVSGGFTNEIVFGTDIAGFDFAYQLAWQPALSEPASYTFVFESGQANDAVTGIIAVYSGVDTSALDVAFVAGSHLTEYVNDATPTCDPITTNTDNALVVMVQFASANAITNMISNSDKTERAENVGSINRNSILCDAVQASAGTFTPLQQAHTNADGTEDGVVITIALKPASAGIIPQAMYHYRHHGD